MKTENFVKEYVRRLSDEELKNLSSRFVQNLCGDTAEIADILSKSNDVDKWLRSAVNSVEFFEMMDEVAKLVAAESQKRSQADKDEKKHRRNKSA